MPDESILDIRPKCVPTTSTTSPVVPTYSSIRAHHSQPGDQNRRNSELFPGLILRNYRFEINSLIYSPTAGINGMLDLSSVLL